MLKFRIIYIVSLAILGTVIGFIAFQHAVTDGEYSTVLREGVLQTEDQWIIEFDILNHEGIDQNYIISVVVNGDRYSENVPIPAGKMYTFIYHVYRDQVKEGKAHVAIYKEGVATPFEECTFYITFDRQ